MFQFLSVSIALLGVSCVNCVSEDMSDKMNAGDIKPGHDMVKEYHMHVYWFQNNEQQVFSLYLCSQLNIVEHKLFSFFFFIYCVNNI